MNAHLKTLLNVSGIANRNGSLPLVRAGKICANSLMSLVDYLLNHTLRPFDIWTPPEMSAQALAVCLSPRPSAHFDNAALIQSP
jgi:hypothetical protein